MQVICGQCGATSEKEDQPKHYSGDTPEVTHKKAEDFKNSMDKLISLWNTRTLPVSADEAEGDGNGEYWKTQWRRMVDAWYDKSSPNMDKMEYILTTKRREPKPADTPPVPAVEGKDLSGEKIVELCRDELLKHLHPMMHLNEYPSEAVPKATILSLPALMKSHLKPTPTEPSQVWPTVKEIRDAAILYAENEWKNLAVQHVNVKYAQKDFIAGANFALGINQSPTQADREGRG